MFIGTEFIFPAFEYSFDRKFRGLSRAFLEVYRKRSDERLAVKHRFRP